MMSSLQTIKTMSFHLNFFLKYRTCIFVDSNLEYRTNKQTNKIDLKQNYLKVDTLSLLSQKNTYKKALHRQILK